MAEDRYRQILKQYWGYDDFRGIQLDIIESVCAGRDTLGLMPTGGGKSICFQVPALAMEGVCIVVTPLISLMKDQVANLKRRGIKAEAVYSGMMREDTIRILDNCVLGGCTLLYVSPERLGTELFQAKLVRMRRVSLIVVDEAHCISQWGYDFRPAYMNISSVRSMLPADVPVLALTATATPAVVDDIQRCLAFRERNVFSMSFERKNLIYVVRRAANKDSEILHILASVTQGSVIIYVRTREDTYELAKFLNEKGVTASGYHAGLTAAEKDFRQINWTKDRVRVMVATNAFGMGIDKPDVRLVIHYSMPDSIEAYFQEAGRAGRDGKDSYAVLLYDDKDLKSALKRVDSSFPAKEYIKDTYENLACFFEIGVGEAEGRSFFFPIELFCKQFRMFPVQVDSALKLLNNAGYIEYHEEREFQSALHFILRKDQLYTLSDNEGDTDAVIQCILRNYVGVFAGFVYIEEAFIAHATGVESKRVFEILKELHRRRVIDFIPHRKTPTITYTVARVETERVFLPESVYEARRNDLRRRINAMGQYVSADKYCRSRMLLYYFGEKDAKNCGRCDVCVEARKNGAGVSREEAKEAERFVVGILSDGRKHVWGDFFGGKLGSTVGKEAIRHLIDEEMVETDVSGMKLKGG